MSGASCDVLQRRAKSCLERWTEGHSVEVARFCKAIVLSQQMHDACDGLNPRAKCCVGMTETMRGVCDAVEDFAKKPAP